MRYLTLFSLLLRLPLVGFGGAQPRPIRSDVYIVPFSHPDLFWAGTQEECLSRINRIITRAIQLAQKHPEFRFVLEDNIFVANFADSQQGSSWC